MEVQWLWTYTLCYGGFYYPVEVQVQNYEYFGAALDKQLGVMLH